MSHIESSLDLTQQPALPAYHIASVGRVLTLLKAFADRQQLTVSEAAHLLGVAPSTAHRMLQMLVFHGFATHTDDHTYHRGPAIAALAAGVRRTEMGSVVKPRLIALRDDLPGGTVHLITLEGNGGRFVAGVQSRIDPGLAISRVGWLLPAHTLAGGRSLLAHLPAREIDALYPDGLPLTRYARVKSVRQLSSVLDQVRGRGFAVSREAHKNVCAVGVTVETEADAPTTAVSVSWPDTRFPIGQLRDVLRRVRETADELADVFEWPDAQPSAGDASAPGLNI